MQCPSCKEQIDDDSRYCDQCGGQIFVCVGCGRPGKGKRCIFDGKELVLAGNGSSAGSAGAVSPSTAAIQPDQTVHPVQTPPPVQIPSPTVQPVQMPPIASSIQQAPPMQSAPQSVAVGDKVKFSSQMHGIMIEAQDGDVIGRKTGAFTGILSRFNYVSGTHCRILKTSDGWHIQDLGSTNGTFYNGNRLTPNMIYPITSNSMVRIADLDLLITYNSPENGTQRL